MDAAIDKSEPGDCRATRQALLRLGSCVGGLVLLAAATYAHPGLVRVRPWVAGEGVPIARMYQERQALPTFAEAGHDLAASDLPEGVGDLLAASAPTTTARPTAAPEAGRASLGASGASTGADAAVQEISAGPAVHIDADEYAGAVQAIENPEALAPFFRQLKRAALGRPGGIARIAHYGDSSVAADAITRTARRMFQQRFGDSGHGFILISRGDMHYAHADIQHRSKGGWQMLSATRSQLSSGMYGYGGVQARGRPGASATFGTSEKRPVGGRVSRYELFFQRFKRGGRVRLRLDGSREHDEIVDTKGSPREDGYHALTVPDGPHKLSLKVIGGRSVRLYGMALERDEPGVVYDSLGLVGARAQRLLNMKATQVAAQIAHRKPHLLVLGFGGNEAGNKWLDVERYEQELGQVVDHMRAGRPEMACLLFAPLDQAEKNARGRVITIDKLPKIVNAQRRVAVDKGCAFFDTYQAMGGAGSMGRWVRSRPKLAASDLRHATPDGYRVIGTLYYKAMLKAFAEWL